MNDHLASLKAITGELKERRISPEELAVEVASRIRASDGLYNSFISVNQSLREDARLSESSGELSRVYLPLRGIPFAVKDLLFTDQLPTTGGSRAPVPEKLKGRRQGEAVERLLQAGALLAGKNNLHEYAFGITNENDHFGPVLNPWDITRVSGGSSGGSAAAVAAGLVPFALGTDTRGSIRIPSACCGMTGLKPTYGRISVSGVVPLSVSLDHVGPITRNVEDSEFVFRIMAGEDPPYGEGREKVNSSARPFRIGICEYYFTHLDREIAAAVSAALDVFRREGMEVRDLRLPGLEESLDASDVVSRAEGYAFHRENLEAHQKRYGEPVFRRLCSGGELSAVDLVNALEAKEMISRGFDQAFREVDCLIAPTLPVTAVSLGTRELDIDGSKEPIVRGFVRFNAPQNMSGVPCLSLPCGFSASRLPVGMQLIAARNREDILFTLGKIFQSRTDWHLRRPGL